MSEEWIAILPVLVLLGLVLLAFIREWAAPEIIAMSAFCIVVAAGLLPLEKAYTVFGNSAPITIAAMFVLSAALEKTGVIDYIGHILNRIIRRPVWLTLPPLMALVAACSAFVNNTPVVAIFLPVVLALCRRKHLAASKVLIPLSYAAILGGCCTLIGTSTNIIVNDFSTRYEMEPMGMFEFTPLGLILLGVGTLYVVLLGPALLPERQGVTALLGPEERRQFICHLLIKPGSPLIGQFLTQTPLGNPTEGFRIIEVRRDGSRLALSLNLVRIKPYDRVMLAVSSKRMQDAGDGTKTLDSEFAREQVIENLSTIEGAIIEGIIAPHSHLLGNTLKSSRFRQRYGMLVLAAHRKGKNLASDFKSVELEFGDTLLLLGPLSTFSQLREEGDFTLLEDLIPERGNRKQATIALAAMAGVVAVSSLTTVPVVFAATVACVAVLWLKCLNPQEAYKAIDWSVVFMLYGMLAVGEALTLSGAPQVLAHTAVLLAQNHVAQDVLPYVALAFFYLMGSLMTEILSNTATAVILAPIAIGFANSLQLDPRPFVFAVAFSSSAAFSTPIGYQTNMMVYGAGGYRFSDFLKFGLPLNLILWAVAVYFIPRFWPFHPIP